MPVTARVRKAGLAIRDILNAPNLCTFTIEGTAPTVGQEVRVSLYDTSPANVLFGGTIDTVAAFYEALPANRAWTVTCQDYTLGLNRRKVRIRYGQQGAQLIALDLLARYGPAGYTGAGIVQPLPTVPGGIDFTEEDLSDCFARLAQRIGGYWYVDYEKAVHLFLSEVLAAPDAIVPGGRLLLNEPPITQSTDVTQIRTRVWVEGGGAPARLPAAPGETQLAVVDAGWYPEPGLVVSGPQRIAYTAKGTIGDPGVLTATPIPGAGNLAGGPYYYKYSFLTGGDEGLLSMAAPAVSFLPVAAPPVAVTLTGTATGGFLAPPPYVATNYGGGGPDAGQVEPGMYYWVLTFRTAAGETSASPAIYLGDVNYATVYMFQNMAIPPAGALAKRIYRSDVNGALSTAKLLEEIPANTVNYTDNKRGIDRLPASPPATNTSGGAAALTAGATYHYKVTFLTALGETDAGPDAVQTLTTAMNAAQVSAIPVSADGQVIGRRLYRTKAPTPTGPWYLEATINDNTTTTYLSTKPDAQLGAALGGYTAGQTGQVSLTNISIGPAGTTARRVYRTAAGGTAFGC